MRTISFKALRDGVFNDLNYTEAQQTTDAKATVTSHINTALDMAYPWMECGWPELRKATSETVTSQVIDLANVGTDLYFGVSRVLSVSKNHPWKSSRPMFYDFAVTVDGITVTDLVTDTSLYVAHIEAPPVYNSAAWAAATAYVVGDVRFQGNDCYYCLSAHTSGTFATDLAAARWLVLPVPAFLQTPVRTAVAGAMAGYAGGQHETHTLLLTLMRAQLALVAERHT